MIENKISYAIRGAAFNVFNELGPGMLESVYEQALVIELEESGYIARNQVAISVSYKGHKFDQGFRADIIVDDLVIVEIKSVETLAPVHFKQLLTYLKLTDKKLGLLINFNADNLSQSIKRVANNL